MPVTSTLGHAPKYTVRAGPRTPVVEGLKFASVANGGHDRLEGFISNSERVAGGANYKAWKPLSVEIASGETGAGTKVWEGYVWSDVQNSSNNKCRLSGIGAAEIARTTYKTILFRADDLSLWMTRDADEANFPANYRNIGGNIEGRLLYEIKPGGFSANNIGGFCCVIDYAKITRMSWVSNKGVARPAWAWLVRSFDPPLVNADTGNTIHVNQTTLASNGPVSGSTITVNVPAASQRRGISLELKRTADGTIAEGNEFAVAAKYPRVYGVATSDNYFASSVMSYLGSDLGWGTTGVAATTTPILPVYWQHSSPLSDLMDQMCVADQMWWGVFNKSGGAHQLEFKTWTGGTNWFIDVTDPAVGKVDLDASEELINGARAFYETLGGRKRIFIVYSNGLNGRPQDPFAGTDRSITGRPVLMDYDIPDRQPDDTYPSAIANGLVKYWGVQRYEGTVELASAHSGSLGGTEAFACNITAGDRLTITNGSNPGTYEIHQAEHDQSGLTRLTIGPKPGTFDALVAKNLKSIERKGLG